MCLAIPYQVLEVKDEHRGLVEVAGDRREVSLQLVPNVRAGDYVLCNFGYAIAKIEEREAMEVMRLYQEMAEAAAL